MSVNAKLVDHPRRKSAFHFALLAALPGFTIYWLIWEFLPVSADHRDGRYDSQQTLNAFRFLDYPEIGAEFAGQAQSLDWRFGSF